MIAGIVENEAELVAIARDMKTIAVLGIKDDRDPDAAAYATPAALAVAAMRVAK